ncbi:hypothetical protein [Streptomyces varsoviensis]|uniref:Alpha-xenorhabdolysin family binary toxin subunit A n=1 Tax=Streptomyces varsoviensis TaxID=67373 RepID=A0ABR5IXI2_9ACTN|nr:hypothetical protein [Streptomyces varsoviensis]KOG85844.1 hypothetical protein ADK38_34405 [Streptomyces varsoviensis]
MATPTLLPPSKELLLKATDKQDSKQPDFTYAMFGEEWLHIQMFVTSILKMKIATTGDFTKNYGKIEAADEKAIKDFIGSVTAIQKLSTRFGDPVTILDKIKTDGNYLTSATAPSEVYGQNIWMAYQVHNTARKFEFFCGNLQKDMDDGQSAIKKNAENVRDLLVGPQNGLKNLIDKLVADLKAIMQNLASFSGDFRAENDKLKLFVAKEGKIYSHAVTARDECKKEAQEFQDEADATYAKWKKFTIAACSSIAGGLIGVLTAIGLGIYAAILRKKYNALLNKVKQMKDEQFKKVALVTDLDGLRTQVTPLTKYTENFQTHLDLILGKWQNTSNSIAQIANLDDNALGNKNEIAQKLGLQQALDEWKEVAKATEWFTGNSLVSPSRTEFGEPLPA